MYSISSVPWCNWAACRPLLEPNPNKLPCFPISRLKNTLRPDQVAEEVLSEAGIDRPPVDVLAVARALNIQVAWDDTQPGRARCVRLQGFNGARPARRSSCVRIRVPNVANGPWPTDWRAGGLSGLRHPGVDPRLTPPNARERSPINWPAGCCCPGPGLQPTPRPAAGTSWR